MASMYLEMGDLATAPRLAEDAVEVVAKDDWATVASAGSVLGTVRAAQGRTAEAERLLREAAAVMADDRVPTHRRVAQPGGVPVP